MARGVNKVILIGHLGQDPQSRAMPSGKAVVNLRLATSDQWRDKQTGENKEATEWHNVVMFDRLAEIAAEYLRKGSHVYVEGRIRTRKWQDKEGHDRYTTEIVANEMNMLGGRGGRPIAARAPRRRIARVSAAKSPPPAPSLPASPNPSTTTYLSNSACAPGTVPFERAHAPVLRRTVPSGLYRTSVTELRRISGPAGRCRSPTRRFM